jgi:hypothetical protein
VGPSAGLDTGVTGKLNPLPLPGIEPRSPGRPARSQTLYCLSYPAPLLSIMKNNYAEQRVFVNMLTEQWRIKTSMFNFMIKLLNDSF